MANLSKRLDRLEDINQTLELARQVRDLSDEELITLIKATYRRLVSVGWMEEEIPKHANE